MCVFSFLEIMLKQFSMEFELLKIQYIPLHVDFAKGPVRSDNVLKLNEV